MSLVVCVITKKSAILVGDKRQCSKVADHTTVVSEYTQKVFQINNNVAIGFTGNYEASMKVKNGLIAWMNANPSINVYADMAAHSIQRLLDENQEYIEPPVQCVITGISKDGNIVFFTIDGSNKYEIDKRIVSSLNPVHFTQLGDYPKNKMLNIAIQSIVNGNQNGDIENEIIDIVKNYISLISTKSKTVNANTDVIVIS